MAVGYTKLGVGWDGVGGRGVGVFERIWAGFNWPWSAFVKGDLAALIKNLGHEIILRNAMHQSMVFENNTFCCTLNAVKPF